MIEDAHMSATLNSNIDFFIKNNMNILFRGRHGTGKTARILEAFEKHGLKYQYFSAATMDPWVDFIGIPKEKTIDGKSYLELIRPKVFEDDEVEAIFLDEYNRAPKKVRNATMELIQFKSINGKKFKNLRLVFCAINPEEDGDDKYDVEALDPAQIDRFHALIEIPYTPDLKYFKGKYDENSAIAAVTWWKELTPELQRFVSPRRLDYALEVHTKGGDLRYVLTNDGLNLNKLITELQNGPISANLKKLYDASDAPGAKTFLAAENNYAASVPYIIKKKEYSNFFIPLLSDERIISLMNKEKLIEDLVFAHSATFMPLIEDISKNPTSKVAKRATGFLQDLERQKMIAQQHAAVKNGTAGGFTGFFNSAATSYAYDNAFANGKLALTTTAERQAFYDNVSKYLPKEPHLCKVNRSVFDNLMRVAITSHGHKVVNDMPNLISMLNHILAKSPEFKASITGARKDYLVQKFPNLMI